MRSVYRIEPTSELEVLSVDRAAKVMRVRPDEIVTAMDLWVQSDGHDGLAFFTRGSHRRIRAGAIKEWLVAQERKELVG